MIEVSSSLAQSARHDKGLLTSVSVILSTVSATALATTDGYTISYSGARLPSGEPPARLSPDNSESHRERSSRF